MPELDTPGAPGGLPLKAEFARAQAEGVTPAAPDSDPPPGSAGGDARALRGIPAIAPRGGMGSAIPGSNPVAALLAKQPRD